MLDHHDLCDRWRREVQTLRRHGAVEAAASLEACIADLEQFDREYEGELLDLTSAALERGVHPDTISRYIKAGRLADHGRPGSPRVRRGDLLKIQPASKRKPVPRTDSGLPDLAAEVTGRPAS